MSRFSSRCSLKVILCAWAILLYGCAAYKPPDSVQTFYERVSQKVGSDLTVAQNEFEVHCFPIVNEKVARTNLGIDPEEFEVLPVFLKVENMSQNPVKVDLPNSFITIGGKQTTYMDIDSVVERIAKKDADAALVLGMFFGVIGGVAGGVGGAAGAAFGGALGAVIDSSKVGSGTVEEHYYRQSFDPVFIQPKNSGSGLVFYHLSKEDLECEELTLVVPIVDLNTNNISDAKFNFKPANFKTIKERK